MPGDELRETRETVGDAFDGAEPGRPCANRSKKSRQNRRGCFVAPVAKQAGEANAQNGAVEPGVVLCGRGRRGGGYTTFTARAPKREWISAVCAAWPAALALESRCLV